MSTEQIPHQRDFDERHFYALTSLLRLRNGGQLEEPSSPGEDWDSSAYLLSEAEENDSIKGLADSTDYDKELKQRFLDRVAELMSDDRGGSKVTATLLVEGLDTSQIYIAQNTDLDAKARKFLATLETFVQDVSRANDLIIPQKSAVFVYKAVEFQRVRIRAWLKGFRDKFKGDKSLQGSNDGNTNNMEYAAIQRLLNDLYEASQRTGIDEIGKLVTCVQKAYEISKFYCLKGLKRYGAWDHIAVKLPQNILYLARTQIAVNVIERGGRKSKFCENLTFIPISLNKVASTEQLQKFEPVNARPLDFDSTLKLVGFQHNDPRICQHLSEKLTLETARKRFGNFQAEPRTIHAEMRLVVEMHDRELLKSPQLFDYTGCSKRSCYLCGRATEYYGFRTRGCHQKLYHRWAIPVCPMSGATESFRACMYSLQESLFRKLRTPSSTNINHSKESTVGSSSMASENVIYLDNPNSVGALQKHMYREHEAVTNQSSELSEVRGSSPPTNYSTEPGEPPEVSPLVADSREECEVCERWTYRRCSLCHHGWFCSKFCEDRAGPSHVFRCTGRQPTTADWLYELIILDELPKDEQVRKDFGFDRCRHWLDESSLMGLYKGLYLMEVPALDIHKWRVEGILVNRIIEQFRTLPEEVRGGYFPWFMRNRFLLEGDTIPHDLAGDFSKTMQQVNHRLGASDQIISPFELQPLAKRYGYLVMARSFKFQHLPPSAQFGDTNIWYELGYASCGKFEEMKLGGLYTRLLFGNRYQEHLNQKLGGHRPVKTLPLCGFDEFWVAWEKGKLFDCFERYGLGSEIDKFKGLRVFLSYPLGSKRPEIYGLMRHLRSEENDSDESIQAAKCFGFVDALNAKQRTLLPDLYKELLSRGKPQEIQDALIRGQVWEHAQSILTNIDEDLEPVLRSAGIMYSDSHGR